MAKKARRSGGSGGKRARRAKPRTGAAAVAVLGAIAGALTRPSVRARIREMYELARGWVKDKTGGPIERPVPTTGPAADEL